jgi:hypothetical protein
MARPSSGKRDIDQAKRARAARKRERRGRTGDDVGDDGVADTQGLPDGASEQELLQALAELQARFDADELGFESYEERKTALLEQLANR